VQNRQLIYIDNKLAQGQILYMIKEREGTKSTSKNEKLIQYDDDDISRTRERTLEKHKWRKFHE
jgi:hypothetical protein